MAPRTSAAVATTKGTEHGTTTPTSAPPVRVEYTRKGRSGAAAHHIAAPLLRCGTTGARDAATRLHRWEGVAMAAPLIAALRTRRDLKESLLHSAQELAHRASIYGVVRVSYGYLALKCHCSRRTVIRHIQRLVDAGIIRKSVLWIRGNYCEVNTYAFLLAWEKRPATGGSDKTASKFPPRTEEREKAGSLEEKQRLDTWGQKRHPPGVQPLYQLVAAHQASP